MSKESYQVEKTEEVTKEAKIKRRPPTPMVERFQNIKKNIETENDIINQIVAGLNKDTEKKEEGFQKASRYGKQE